MKFTQLLVLAFFTFLIGCESSGGLKPGATDTQVQDDQSTENTEQSGDTSTETFALGDCEPNCLYPKSAIENPESLLAKRVVFFEFDSDDIGSEFNNILIAHAKYLANNPDVIVRLEGHTDARGTREYNLALSEKRAQAVRLFLMLYGAQSDSIETHGFGEELPLALGDTEAAWAQNRRVELVYD